MALITIEEQQVLKPLSANWVKMAKLSGGVSHFEQLAEEVESVDLAKLLGYALYQDIVKNPAEARNVTLLEGGTFTDCNGLPVDFKGIKYQLAYFNYQRYVNSSSFSDTATGMRQKTGEKSEPLRDGIIKRETQFSNAIAMNDFSLMEMFLNENSDTYTLWICSNEKKNRPTSEMINLRNTYK